MWRPEHDPETAGEALCLLLEEVWLGVADEAGLPQQVPLLAAGVEPLGEPEQVPLIEETCFSLENYPSSRCQLVQLTCGPVGDSPEGCRGDGGTETRTSPSPPSAALPSSLYPAVTVSRSGLQRSGKILPCGYGKYCRLKQQWQCAAIRVNFTKRST